MFSQIKVSNFKSFKELTIDLENFNVIIGANASGKSNFLSIFKFLRDIVFLGLDDAIANQGGIKYIKNLELSNNNLLELNIVDKGEFSFGLAKKDDFFHVEFSKTEYSIAIEMKDSENYEIAKEEIILTGIYFKSDIDKDTKIKSADEARKKKIGKERNIKAIVSKSDKGELITELSSEDDLLLKKEDLIPESLKEIIEDIMDKNSNFSFLESPLSNFPVRWGSIFRNLRFYDIDPKKCKQVAKLPGKKYQLKENGENLAVIIQNILSSDKKSKKFLNLVKELIPIIEDIDFERFIDYNSIIFKIKEKYSKKNFIPAWLISDGTNNAIALVVALYFIKSNIIFIEEPERNMYPKVLSNLVQMIKEAAIEKQIIITSHNPEILKYVEIENIRLISRDNDGFSVISKPSENEDVNAFLDEELGIDELFVNDLLM